MRYLPSETQFIAYSPIDLKDADFYIRDGWGNQSGVLNVTNTDIEPLGESTVALTGCALYVPLNTTVHFGNDSTDTEYTVTARTTDTGTDAVWTIFLDTATGGTYTITYQGQTTNAIAYDAADALIQLELEALDGIGNGDVIVTSPAADIILTFADDMADQPVTGLTWTPSLTGAGSETFTNTTPGVYPTTTTGITVSPVLAEEIAASGTVTFTGQLLEVRIGEGNVTYDETVEIEYIKNRGRLDTVREGDEVPMDVAFDFMWEWINSVAGSDIPTIEDVLKQAGEASAWVSTSTDPCEKYCVDLEIRYDPNCGGDNNEKLSFPQFRYEKLSHDLGDSSVACTGKCNVTQAVGTRGYN